MILRLGESGEQATVRLSCTVRVKQFLLESFRFMSRLEFSWERLVLVAASMMFIAAVSLFVALGRYNRYMADDYCYAAALHQRGFVNAQVNNYFNWSGRFTYPALMSAAESIGPQTPSIGPPLCLALWLLASFWALYQIVEINRCPQPFVVATLGAGLIVYAMLNLADNLAQSVYWEAGYLLYAVPLVLLTIYIGMICYATRRRLRGFSSTAIMIVAGVLTLFAGGINEPFTFSQLVTHIMALAICYFAPPASARKRALPFVVAGLIGATVALVLMVTAPGNKVRQSMFPVSRDWVTVAELTLRGTCGFILRKIIQAPLTTTLICLIPALLGLRHYESQTKTPTDRIGRWPGVVALSLTGFALVFLCYLPGVYGAGGLVARARFTPQFVFVCTAIAASFQVGSLVAPYLHVNRMSGPIALAALSLIAAISIVSCSRTIWRTARLLPKASANALRWDETDRHIRSLRGRGFLDQTIPAIDDLETNLGGPQNELQVERDPANWKNQCVSRYYGINSIQSR